MSADKKNTRKTRKATGAPEELEISGRVVIKKIAKGSKSEHEGVYLETDKESFVLRKIGANPFRDDTLEKMEGKMVTATGLLNKNLFLARDVKEMKEKK